MTSATLRTDLTDYLRCRAMQARALELPDVLLLEPDVYTDERGFFYEAWNRREFASTTGFDGEFLQDNQSRSRRSVLRGLHYQLPNPQGKLVRVVQGATFTVAVDVRRSSATFGRWAAAQLAAEDRRQLWIPEGFAHGFLTLADPTDVVYKVTAYHKPGCEHSIRWDDPTIGIAWPLEGSRPLLSARDREAPLLTDAEVYD
jgi:dTDP-4-dehydrorhamnose 3,5-epimerase